MTYRELLELYKAGELELEQRKKVEKDIERQEAISDYLYEREDIPELSDIFEDEGENNKRSEEEKDIQDKECVSGETQAEKVKGRIRSSKNKKDKKNSSMDNVDTEFIKMVNRSIRRAFRRLGLTVLAAAFVLILFFQQLYHAFIIIRQRILGEKIIR